MKHGMHGKVRGLSSRTGVVTVQGGPTARWGQIPRCARDDNAGLRRALLGWYRRAARDLPWRRTRDPYRIWLAEILLQQTRIETGLPYYERFVARLPTVRALADASLDDVLKLWAGLGYYARARNLHKTARIVVQQHGGVFPASAAALEKLPGIGRYTAGAIASIAFGERVAAVDGNVKRVLARLFAITTLIDQPRTLRRLWKLAETLLSPRWPGQFNQALMELGARVCIPRRPLCASCPVRAWCAAAASGIQGQLPRRRRAKSIPHVHAVAAVIQRNGRYLIVKRPPRGLLGGLWELPGCAVSDGEAHAEVLERSVRDLLGSSITVGKLLGTVRHVFSHRVLELHVYRCAQRGRLVRTGNGRVTRWVLPRQFDDYAFASVDRKVLNLL